MFALYKPLHFHSNLLAVLYVKMYIPGFPGGGDHREVHRDVVHLLAGGQGGDGNPVSQVSSAQDYRVGK